MTLALPALYEALYVSVLAPETPITAVAAIASHARVANAQRGITGLLVFDGQWFCQQLEGGQEDVLATLARIGRDARHGQVVVVYQGPLAVRRFADFRLAFSTVEDTDTLAALALLEGTCALQAFEQLRAHVLL